MIVAALHQEVVTPRHLAVRARECVGQHHAGPVKHARFCRRLVNQVKFFLRPNESARILKGLFAAEEKHDVHQPNDDV